MADEAERAGLISAFGTYVVCQRQIENGMRLVGEEVIMLISSPPLFLGQRNLVEWTIPETEREREMLTQICRVEPREAQRR